MNIHSPNHQRIFGNLAKALGEDDHSPAEAIGHVIDRDEFSLLIRALQNHMEKCSNLAHEMRVRDFKLAELSCNKEYHATRDLLNLIEQSHEITVAPGA